MFLKESRVPTQPGDVGAAVGAGMGRGGPGGLAPSPLLSRGREGLGRAEAKGVQGGEQGRLLFLPTRWRCLPSARQASCHPSCSPTQGPAHSPAGESPPVETSARLPADHALLSPPLPGALSCPLSCARSPAHPGPRPEHALRPGGTDILQPAGHLPQRLPLPRPAAAPVRTWWTLTFFTSCWGQETRCKKKRASKNRAVL